MRRCSHPSLTIAQHIRVLYLSRGEGYISRVSTVGQKRGVPGPVAFPLSLPGLDRASSVLPRGQRPGFSVAPHCRTKIQGRGWIHIQRVEIGRFRGGDG